MKIYTKTGDKGRSTSVDGKRRAKSDLIFEVEGGIDALNAHIGFVLAIKKDHLENDNFLFLKSLQHQLFEIGAYFWKSEGSQYINMQMIEVLEKEIDRLSETLPVLENFILPGGNQIGAYLHVARVKCRDLERVMVRFNELEMIDPLSIQFINRLSDYLFTLSRYCNNKGESDVLWSRKVSF